MTFLLPPGIKGLNRNQQEYRKTSIYLKCRLKKNVSRHNSGGENNALQNICGRQTRAQNVGEKFEIQETW